MSADYKSTIILPATDFPMKAGLPKREPEILSFWESIGLYQRQREAAKGRDKFILHDGPPYANGHLHIGHALNKILKDVVNRTQQMLGKDANYVPGWDCHGLPIEWKIEEKYRAAGKNKDEVPIVTFRQECREFAQHWIDVQREEFKRLGVIGDWDHPYATMDYAAEAQIVREIGKFLMNGLLYHGSKPVMWSVVEKTALAEAEVEYHDFVSDQVWVKFGIARTQMAKTVLEIDQLLKANIVIWTTTPWTLPGNRAIAYSPKIKYGLYEVTSAPEGNWTEVGETLIVADTLAKTVFEQARVVCTRLREINPADILTCRHPLANVIPEYGFDIPMLAGEHVTEDTGTGFVHTAPGHGREDFEIWMANAPELAARGINTAIPYTVDGDGFFTEQAPGFTGKRVITDKGEKGDANEAVIKALKDARALIARAKLTHQYPHSWRSKKPVIFRNTPQWFIAMDRAIGRAAGTGRRGDTLRSVALAAIKATRWVPPQGENRIAGMIESRPDWVISRQRAWGVPIAVFVSKKTGEPLRDPKVLERVVAAVEKEGADVWFASDPSRFLGNDHAPEDYDQVTDILDVWFESGATHGFVLEARPDLQWPASLYLEGSDQHRGWFHSSLLESCGTRGRAPYDAVLTHGFVLAEDGQKMSKSLGNIVSPQEVVEQHGADILRLWVVGSDYAEDLRIGPEILKQTVDIYRRLRNTLRYLLGSLNGFQASERVEPSAMPELERWVLHRLWQLDGRLRQACHDFAFHPFFTELHTFCAVDLSAFYFDIRKDSLYCDRVDSPTRRAARTVLDILFEYLTAWLAPFICFTAEEAWRTRHPGPTESVHLRLFPEVPTAWRNDALAERWAQIRDIRRVVTGKLELARAAKKIGSSLQAAPVIFADSRYDSVLKNVDWAEVCITSTVKIRDFKDYFSHPDTFELADVPGVVVGFELAPGVKCERCWKVLPDVGRHANHPTLCGRCVDAVRHHAASAA